MSAESGGVSLLDTLLIHTLLIATFGGMAGVNEQGFGKLESALAAPDESMFGEDLYPDLADKAGALFYRLARTHGFADGNKRVALVALIVYLERNGARLSASDDDLYAFTMAVATDATQAFATAWIAERLTRDDDQVPVAI
jgi:death on curing protein